MKQYQAWLDKGLRDWKDKVLSLAPRAEEFLTQIESSDQLIRARYHDVVMSRWSNDRAVVIGDAAHAMSPQLGQGVNLALFDAMVLSQCIAEQPTVSEALQSYNQQRKHHLGFYQFATRWATPFFQSSLSSLGWIRDLLFPVGLAIPPFRKQMLRSMAGVKRGIMRFSIPMEELEFKQLPAVDQSQKE